MSTKKVVSYFVTFVFLIVGFLWIWLAYLTMRDIDGLLLCSQGRDDWVPRSFCQAYLFKFRGVREDIAKLNEGIGVAWVLRAEPLSDREKMLDFLIQKGVDINAVDPRSGITALHVAVLENDLVNVELLLSRNANPSVIGGLNGLTPLQLALALSEKPNQPDRRAIIGVLEKFEHPGGESEVQARQ